MIEEEKEYDAIMVECQDEIVTKDSLCCITNYNTKTKDWLCGLMEIIPMKNVLDIKKKKVAKDKNVQDFLEVELKKKMRS